jgi:hypothetical protein
VKEAHKDPRQTQKRTPRDYQGREFKVNTLRILSLVCGASRIKQLIGLLTLLLLWPAFASAACPPTQVCMVTGGSAVATSSDSSVPFNFAGNGFSASGVFAGYGSEEPQFGEPFEAGAFLELSMGGGLLFGPITQFALTVNGVPWGIPAGSDVEIFFNVQSVEIPEDFNTSCCMTPFDFLGSFTGAPEPFPPGLSCDVLKCETLNFQGAGVVTFDGHTVPPPDPNPDPDNPFFFFLDQATYKFVAAPEPATLSLFALGLAGLGFMRQRRKN